MGNPVEYLAYGQLPTAGENGTVRYVFDPPPKVGTWIDTGSSWQRLHDDRVINVMDYGATGDGTTDDTAAIQLAFDAVAASGNVLFFPKGTYGVTATINCAGQTPSSALPVVVMFAGTENVTRIKCLSDISGPVFNCAPTTASASPSWQFQNVYIDAQLAPSASCLYVTGVQLLRVEGCKFRSGAIGLKIGAVSAGWFSHNTAYNQTTAGYQYDSGTTTNSQGHTWNACYFFMSTGATQDLNAGWLDLSGHQDQTYVNCRVTRSPGIAYKLPYGWKLDGTGSTVANASNITSGASWFINCICDSIVDGNNPGTGTTGAAWWLSELSNIKMTQCWSSALDTAQTWRQPSIYMNNCFRMDIDNCYLSGTGMVIAGTNDIIHIRDNHFPNASTADPCITLSGATITNLYTRGNTKEKNAAAWFDNATTAQTAMIDVGNVL